MLSRDWVIDTAADMSATVMLVCTWIIGVPTPWVGKILSMLTAAAVTPAMVATDVLKTSCLLAVKPVVTMGRVMMTVTLKPPLATGATAHVASQGSRAFSRLPQHAAPYVWTNSFMVPLR